MLGFKFIKAQPTTYLLQYRGGKVIRDGLGLSFFYYAPTTSLVAVPVGSADVPFIFHEITGDFQSVTIQGQVTYRVSDPFPTRTTGASMVFGRVTPDAPLVLESQMAENGVIFSDGIENDFLEFNSGTQATIDVADRKGVLVE